MYYAIIIIDKLLIDGVQMAGRGAEQHCVSCDWLNVFFFGGYQVFITCVFLPQMVDKRAGLY